MSVRDPWLEPKFLYGCKRLAVLFEKFCVGVRDLRCNPESSIAQKNTHDYGYHIDFELCDRSRDSLGISCPLALALGTSEPVRAQHKCAIGTTNDGCHTWYRHV